jgi:DNA helicase-2/ATP-dependent DNA helicase PcrA
MSSIAKPKNLLDKLNPEQRRAVETINGRLLILAGAGSGKTSVLTCRIAHLINDHNVDPEQILGLTFTNKAAAEMRHRAATLIAKEKCSKVTLSTFHSFCLRILRREIHRLGYTTQFTIYDEKDVQRLVNLIARDILKNEGMNLPSLASTMHVIDDARNKGLLPEEIGGSGSSWHDEFCQEVFRRLKASMRAYNAVDFNDLLIKTVELFQEYPEVLERYQEQYLYIMIDEYQDTNPIQSLLTTLLSEKHGNLCVVGDDDQSIYGWRGADVKNILNFDDATVIKLEQNYRSTNSILDAANSVIGNNEERHDKELWSDKGDGEKITVFHTQNEEQEAEMVVYRIAQMRQNLGFEWKDFAILYRSNALSRQLEVALMKYTWDNEGEWVRGVPYRIFGGLEFYARREVKDLIAYLRVMMNPRDEEAILRVINQPRRGIGEGSLDKITSFNRKEKVPLWTVLESLFQREGEGSHLNDQVSSQALGGIRRFVEVIQKAKEDLTRYPLSMTLERLIQAIDYEKAIREEVKSQQMREFKWDNVQELVSALSEYEERCKKTQTRASLDEFIAGILLQMNREEKKDQNEESGDKVNLLTFHSAKGLEFPVCFLVGVEDHIIPHEKSALENGVEEERRLMYVAITRAMKHLTISMARHRKRMGRDTPSSPSRFLFEIPEDLLKMN